MKRPFFLILVVTLVAAMAAITACETEEAATVATGEETAMSAAETPGEEEPAVKSVPVDQRAEYVKLTPSEAKEMMEREEVIIVDVRTEDEFKQGHIEGAILIPDYDLDKLAAELLPDKDATILIYCRSGSRSKLASHLMIGMGYQAVYDFGGILDWRYGEVRLEDN